MIRTEIQRDIVHAGYGYETVEEAKIAMEKKLLELNNPVFYGDVWVTGKVWNWRLKGRMLESFESET